MAFPRFGLQCRGELLASEQIAAAATSNLQGGAKTASFTNLKDRWDL